MSEKMTNELWDRLTHDEYPEDSFERVAAEGNRARASEAEKEQRIQVAGETLERARDTLLGIVHGAPLSTVQNGLVEVRAALVALGRKP